MLTAAKGKSLDPENRGYYEPKDIFSAAYKWVSSDKTYRAVRNALIEYDQGEDGKDVFANIVHWRNDTEYLTEEVDNAKASYKRANDVVEKMNKNYEIYDAVIEDVKTDAEILKAAQEKAASEGKTQSEISPAI